MENATGVTEVTPDDHAEGRAALAPDHPVADGPHPSRWACLTGRFRRTNHPARTPTPTDAPPIKSSPEASKQTVRTTSGPVVQSTAVRRIAVALAVLLAAVIVVAFRGSWTSQSDAAKAAHFDPTGAFLYPFAPDGLIVLALIAAVVLRHKFWPRVYCLGVVTLFTVTSYVVNHLHGLGTFQMQGDGKTLVEELDGVVVGLIAVQLVGAIAFGSHILMHVFRHLFPDALDVYAETSVEQAAGLVAPSTVPVEMSDPQSGSNTPAAPEIDSYEFAKLIYATCLDGGVKLSQAKLSTLARISKRKAGYAQVDVDNERAAAEEPEPESEETATVPAARPERVLTVNGSVNGRGPTGGAS
ncbi:DUF2637 domain-containing protein [Streptosporangium sp. NPDC005286]|uniref:DUF2637 domain-containing protein n=1 Tax=Streptosporangium sp. NPDC005286 TaxID=3154463 RepID=UPI0033ACFA6C